MHGDERALVDTIAAAILVHLQSNPLAADSADGVACWWLGPDLSNVTVEQVVRALKLLVSRGALRRLRLMDGTVLYSQLQPTWQ
jgi:hypothetical protein